jgi:hypothetical protein
LVAPLVDGELVAEREDLQMHGTSCSEASAEAIRAMRTAFMEGPRLP